MIADKETNVVYFSELLQSGKKYRDVYQRIVAALDSCGVKSKLLHGTRDIWARDYMPVQVTENEFLEYRYDPDYLQGIKKGRRDLKTYPDIVCDLMGFDTVKTDIILDGGNIVKSSNKVILTDKVLEENKWFYKPEKLIEELKGLLRVDKVIIIPWDTSEEFGHADGMLRFIDDNRVLMNGYFQKYSKKFREALFGALEDGNVEWELLEYDVKKEDERNWAYINFLQTKDIILIPGLGIEEDSQALEQISEWFPEYSEKGKILQVKMPEIIEEGGALNCITWAIKQ